ncbi:MAG: hypothetical protein KZQ64_06045 [gamma proteobacterium symbiont of Bathyaustriella thionipta]|nr:hypothetical protein [gamma proteobacterium symbiont of Bathyaustriella thionipta]MCU7950857.1 hypothetical protein [gamma proteobacterium symbiont of Bathyaustriella thionipta]MCU7952938.1 hypothetical protein [gamma proteobacterium symbiont of Bathyaustriella thionipta]MCU7958071.1 hypothetical protein [gamma proteobacterium symbiont of Bathyaustriella thionipta]MCU7965861.1 hypothetical protein [gamma proteobacterium symbiont of Bathyaustriella thionipta]
MLTIIFKYHFILFSFVFILLGIPCVGGALTIQPEESSVQPLGDGEASLDTIDFSELSEPSLLNEDSFGQTTKKKNIPTDSMSNEENYLLDEINDEYELKQIRKELLKGEYGKVNSETPRNRISNSNRNITKEKVDFNIDSLGEDFDVEQTVDKVVDKVKNKTNNLIFSSEQSNEFPSNSVSTNEYKENKYLYDDNFDRDAFNETFKWTIIYLIIGLISLKLLISVHP